MPSRHPNLQIRLCPRCGENKLSWHSLKHFECLSCGFMLYLNVAAAVAVIIECRGSILFGVRKNDPGKGMLDLPGGFADPGEGAEECARREVLEETGLDIPSVRYFASFSNTYLYREVDYDTLDIIMTARFDELPEAHPGDDLVELLWLPADEIDLNRIAFPSLAEAVRRYLSLECQHPSPQKQG